MMKKAGYALGYAAALWMLFALWVRAMTLGDIAPAARPYYDALAPQMSAADRTSQTAGLVLTLLCLISAFGWAVITALTAAA